MNCIMVLCSNQLVKSDPSAIKNTNGKALQNQILKGLPDPSATLQPHPLSQMKGMKGLSSRRSVKIINNNRQPFNPSYPLYPCKNPSSLQFDSSRHTAPFIIGRHFLSSKSQSLKGESQTLQRPFSDPSASLHTVTGLDSVYTDRSYGQLLKEILNLTPGGA